MAKVKVFISGPITGYENNNRGRFYDEERTLRNFGFDVFNPVWIDFTDSWTHEEIMSVDLAALATCDAIYQLEGWEHSKGALKEFYFAIDHNKDFVTYDTLIYNAGATIHYKNIRVGAPTGVAARMRDTYIARRGIRGGIPFGAPVRPLSFLSMERNEISWLLTNMKMQGATKEELERAIKYSKVVIDAEKDISIDWRTAAIKLGIQELKKKYLPFGVPIYGMKADSVTIDEVHELDPLGLNDKKETENEEN